jgi:hypothetical protein
MLKLPSRQAALAALAIILGLATSAGPAWSQAAPAPAAPAPSAPAEDPLRRETPRGTFLGFVEASQRGNRATAAEYLQWPRQKMPVSREEAADQLLFVLNHGFEGNLDRLSREPAGVITDGLAPDRERAGSAVLANGERVDIYLTRVAQEKAPPIWLVAADTVADIPRLYEHSGLPQIERRLPKFLTSSSFGELQLWVPLALLLLVPVLFLVSRLLLGIVLVLLRLYFRLRGRPVRVRRSPEWKALSWP